jgi:Concanavalin A-like lectin/glucanases superfamily
VNEQPDRSAELDELLGAARDGLLAAEQAARLDQILAEDAEARTYYLEYITLCAILRHYQGHPGTGGVGPPETSIPLPSALPPGAGATTLPAPDSRRRLGRRLYWAAAAAAVVACIVAARWGQGPGRMPLAPIASPLPPPHARDGVALVVNVEGTARGDGASTRRLSEGMVVPAGPLHVDQGSVTLAFFSGVTLTLDGPADLDLLSGDRVFCRSGKLRARVPKGAEGFVIESPGSAVVDLGTEFALNVGADGKSRVMVFEGLAEAALLDESGSPRRTQMVVQSRAFELDSRAGRIAERAAEPGEFVEAPAVAAPSLVLDPGYAEAVLRSRPRAYWRFESLAGGGFPNEVAGGPPLRVHGPINISDGSEGNGCAVFKAGAPEQFLDTDGVWDLAGVPGHAVELWFWSEGFHYASLLGLLPPPEPAWPDPYSKSAHILLLEVTARERQSLHKPASVRYLQRWPIDLRVGDNLCSEAVYAPRRWHHVVAQKAGDRMELYFNGAPGRSLQLVPDHPGVSCQLVVGRRTRDPDDPKDSRSFVGRLDELALYDHPLSAEEIRRHFALATPKARP